MLIIRATRKLLGIGGPAGLADEQDTTWLGPWYATVLPWRRRAALLVSEATLLPVLTRLAPAAGWRCRVPGQIAAVLAAHGTPTAFIQAETDQMREHRLGPTASRSVVGVMNQFAYLADVHRERDADPDLVELSVRLSSTPCGPLYGRHGSPDRELAAVVRATGR